METPFEAITRLARSDLGSGDGTAAFAKWLLAISEEDIAEAVKEGIKAGCRQHAHTTAFFNHVRKMLYYFCNENPSRVFIERHIVVSGGRLLETPEWCLVTAAFFMVMRREDIDDFFKEIIVDDLLEMVDFGHEDNASRLIRSFWRAFFHEVARDPVKEVGKERNRKLFGGLFALYKRTPKNTERQIEIGNFMAEIAHYVPSGSEEIRQELSNLLREDREVFEEAHAVAVSNLLDFAVFFERLINR